MAIDEVSADRNYTKRSESRATMVAAFLILAVLIIGQIYTLSKMASLKESLQAEDGQIHKQMISQLNDQVASKLTALESSNAQQLEAVKTELDKAAKRMGSTGRELARARKMVSKLQEDQAQEANDLKQQIATKADQQQVGALTQDVSATKTDLESTKKTVGTLSGDLGMARSELGTLIARNHDEIETLRKLGQRNYYEFTLNRNQEQKVGGVGLILKKTNVKHYRFNLAILNNDMVVEKNNRTIDEPVFFVADGSKGFYELVVNKVGNNTVSGYVSTPKFVETAEAKIDTNDSAKTAEAVKTN